MAMNATERKRLQRSRPAGYGKSRVVGWKAQGITECTWADYEAKIEAQHGECPICHGKITNRSTLDHSHESGDARGVLCSACNLLLGKVESGGENFFLSAAAYLKQWEAVA